MRIFFKDLMSIFCKIFLIKNKRGLFIVFFLLFSKIKEVFFNENFSMRFDEIVRISIKNCKNFLVIEY